MILPNTSMYSSDGVHLSFVLWGSFIVILFDPRVSIGGSGIYLPIAEPSPFYQGGSPVQVGGQNLKGKCLIKHR